MFSDKKLQSQPHRRGGPFHAVSAALAFAAFSQAAGAQANYSYESPAVPAPMVSCGQQKCIPEGLPEGHENVTLSNGEFKMLETDLVLEGIGLDLVWSRTYRSRSELDGAMGRGWSHSFEVSAEIVSGGIRVSDGTGRIDLYTPLDGMVYANPQLARRVELLTDGGIHVTHSNGTVWELEAGATADAPKRLAAISDRNGNRITCTYDSSGRLIELLDTQNRVWQIQYSAMGLINKVIDGAGRSVQYAYGRGSDGAYDLIASSAAQIDGTTPAADSPEGKITQYFYTSGNSDPRLNHNLIGKLTPGGKVPLINFYSTSDDAQQTAFDRVVTQLTTGGQTDFHYGDFYDRGGEQFFDVIVNDQVGSVNEYRIDKGSLIREVRELTGFAVANQVTTPTTNRPTGKLRASDPGAFITNYAWNSRAQLTDITYPAGNQLSFTYQAPGATPDPITPFNRIERRQSVGFHPQGNGAPDIVDSWTYVPGLGGCCGGELIASHTDANGDVTTYDHDANGNRTRVTRNQGTEITEYGYDANGRHVWTRHPADDLGQRRLDTFAYAPLGTPGAGLQNQRVVDSGGLDLTTTYERDSVGNLTRQVEPDGEDRLFGFDALGLVRWELAPELTDANGNGYRNRRDVEYDLDGWVIRTLQDNRDDQGATLDPARRTMEYVRGNGGEILSSKRLVAGAEWITEKFEYDGVGRRTTTRHPSAVDGSQPSNTSDVTYDERGLAFLRIEAQGFPEEHVVRTDYDLNGLVAVVTEGPDNNARTELTVNDGHDRVLQEVDAMGVVYDYTWSPRGELLRLTATAPAGFSSYQNSTTLLEDSEFEYDYAGRQTTVRCANVINGEVPTDIYEVFDFAPNGDLVFEGMGSGQAEEFGFTSSPPATGTTYVYDTAGRLVAEIGPLGDRIDYQLDAAGRRILQTNTDLPSDGSTPSVTTIATQYDALGRPVDVQYSSGQQLEYGWSSHNEMIRSVDAIGSVTMTHFDGLGRAVERIAAFGTSKARSQQVDWDASSRPIAFIDAHGNAQRIAWNGAGHPIGVRLPDGGLYQFGSGMSWPSGSALPDLSAFATGVDSFGNPISLIDPNQTVSSMVYDLRGNLTLRTITPGPGVSTDVTFERFSYDAFGHLIRAENDFSDVVWEVDMLGKTESETINSHKVEMGRDPMGRLTSLLMPSGTTIGMTRDALDRITSMTMDSSALASFAYRDEDRILRRDNANGTWTRDQHFPDGQISLLENGMGSGSGEFVFHDETITWDLAFNKLLEITAGLNASVAAYVDNELEHVETFAGSNPVQFQYDLMGNRTLETRGGVSTTYTMDDSNGDSAMNRYTKVGDQDLSYDANGNLIERVGSGFHQRYTYSWSNRLVRVEDVLLGETWDYSLDAVGRRIAEVHTSTDGIASKSFSYNDYQVVEERSAAGAKVFAYGGTMQQELVAMLDVPSGQRYWYHLDDMYSVVALSDATGSVVETYDYSEHGQPLGAFADPESGVGNPYRFTGARLDGSGLYHMNARAYDAFLGRFLQIDPGGMHYDPLGAGNGYQYAANAPNRLLDPMGLQAQTPQTPKQRRDGTRNITWWGAAVDSGAGLIGTLGSEAVGLISVPYAGWFILASLAIHTTVVWIIAEVDLANDPEYCIVELVSFGGEEGTEITKRAPDNLIGKRYCLDCTHGTKLCDKFNNERKAWHLPIKKYAIFRTVNVNCDQDCNHPVLN